MRSHTGVHEFQVSLCSECVITAQMSLCWLLALPPTDGSFSLKFWQRKSNLFGQFLDSNGTKCDGWCLSASTLVRGILVSVMDPQCLGALNQARRAWWTALAGGQSAQVGRVTTDLVAVLGDSGGHMGWFLSWPNLLTCTNTA